ncbi:MAG: trypsin-like peptidase domain-containing protein [Acidobacteriota bacterium]
MLTPEQRRAVVKIHVWDGRHVLGRGTGFLVAGDLVATALHVVADRQTGRWLGEVRVEFLAEKSLGLETQWTVGVRVEDGWSSTQDWALLKLKDRPDARPLVLGSSDLVRNGMDFVSRGFPDANSIDGLSYQGQVRDIHGTYEEVAHAFHLYSGETRGLPVQGLSGSPCLVAGKVIGVVRSALLEGGLGIGTIYASPSDLLVSGALDEARGNPFKSLRPYEAADQKRFFGRDEDIEVALRRLEDLGLCILLGDSGCGKSSLARAGVGPAVEAGRLEDGRRCWRTLTLRVESAPYSRLLATLREADLLDDGEAPEPSELGPLLEHRLADGDGCDALLLIVDQMEELFAGAVPDRERHHLLEAMVRLGLGEDSRVKTLGTIRSDSMGRLLRAVTESSRAKDAMQIVAPLSRTGLRQVIRSPLERAGLSIPESLVDHLVNEVADEPGALPLLQFTLHRLWELRDSDAVTWKSYDGIEGGVQGIVTRAADRVMAELDPHREWPVVRRLFELLVDPQSEIATRRAASSTRLRELVPGVSGPLLDRFIAARLVTASERRVEVAHEVLISSWELLQGWIQESRAHSQVKAELLSAAADWPGGAESLLEGARLERVLAWAEQRAAEVEEEHRDAVRYLLISAAAAGRHLDQLLAQIAPETALAAADELLAAEKATHRRLAVTILEQMPAESDGTSNRRALDVLRKRIEVDPSLAVVDRATAALWSLGAGPGLIEWLAEEARESTRSRLRWGLAFLRNRRATAAEVPPALGAGERRRVRWLAGFRLFFDERNRLAFPLILVTATAMLFWTSYGILSSFLRADREFRLGSLPLGSTDFLLVVGLACALCRRAWIDRFELDLRRIRGIATAIVLIDRGPGFVGRLIARLITWEPIDLVNVTSDVVNLLGYYLLYVVLLSFFAGREEPVDNPWRRIWRISSRAALFGSLYFTLVTDLSSYSAGSLLDLPVNARLLEATPGATLTLLLSRWVGGTVLIALSFSTFYAWLLYSREDFDATGWLSALTRRLGRLEEAQPARQAFRPLAGLGLFSALAVGAWFALDLPMSAEQQFLRGEDRLRYGRTAEGEEDLSRSCLRGHDYACSSITNHLTFPEPGAGLKKEAVFFALLECVQDSDGYCGRLQDLLSRYRRDSVRGLEAMCEECGAEPACEATAALTVEPDDSWRVDREALPLSRWPLASAKACWSRLTER